MLFTTLMLVHLRMFLKNLQLFCTHKNCRKSLNTYPIFCLITTPVAVLALILNTVRYNNVVYNFTACTFTYVSEKSSIILYP